MLLCEVAFCHLTPHEGLILQELLCRKYITKTRLIEQLWGGDESGGALWANRSLNVKMCLLRKKLYPSFKIDTEWGQGYRLEET